MPESQIRLLSLNCWGLKFVSKNRKERIYGIKNELANSNHDIIALQELWVYFDFQQIQASVSNRLPYSKFFYSGALGAGLAIFSRFPIISATVYPYSLNGAPIDVAAGDWFVGKAAASVVVRHPVLGKIQIFNTHLFAKGGEEGPEHHRAHRLVNAWEFAKLVRQAAELGRYVIAMGDFNSIPTTLPMAIIREHAGLVDSWVATHPVSSLNQSATSPLEAIEKFGVTADSPLNSYSAGKPLDRSARQFLGKRLDYIFYRQPCQEHLQRHLEAVECQVAMIEKVPGCDFSYSDHFGLEATLDIVIPLNSSDSAYPNNVDSRLLKGGREKKTELSTNSIDTTIQALAGCYNISRQRAKREIFTFALCLMLLIGLMIGSPWINQPWINPLLILLTIFLSWAGTTMLYEGFLYGKWEGNALMNVIEELEIHRGGIRTNA
ncbi:hypothetical protein AMATHDRAFT_74332 [Amanita thiersii Skay4041]|uniref:Endonuclease/exonuclease/phosphatase domain-containing protein n=1 Tax=Amanita thiersii Skay4041 TaxID=703135 RepID=A0A2A9NX12_9AGAR|nr:hypothetical protein AMATHDRAFT_74332 [Amanita thiersii Skay4041]